jgi:hypothetical protein
MANDTLLQFYSGEGTDEQGRTIGDIWGYSHEMLESVHDYIQWLFPLADRSAFNPGAPLLDHETIGRFRRDEILRRNLERSLRVMLEFYGLAIAGHEILRVPSFSERSRDWLTPGNHNFLRLTRILKSLSLLGLENRARQLLKVLEDIDGKRPGIIGKRTLEFWKRAVQVG